MNNFAEKRRIPKLGIMIVSGVCAFMLAAVSLFLPLMGSSENKFIAYADEPSQNFNFLSASYSLPVFCSESPNVTSFDTCFPVGFRVSFSTKSVLNCNFSLNGDVANLSGSYLRRPQIVSMNTSSLVFSVAYFYNKSTSRYESVSSNAQFVFPYDSWQAGYYTTSSSFYFNGFPFSTRFFSIYFRCSSSMDFTKLTMVTLQSISQTELFANSSTEISSDLYSMFTNFYQFKFLDSSGNIATFAIPSLSISVQYPFTLTTRNYYNEYAVVNEDSYENGYNSGHDVGYQEGLQAGNTQGYDSGYSAGSSAGYNKGFAEGSAAGSNYTFMSLISAVIDAPITAVSGLLDFNVFGYNMKNFYFSLLTVCVIIFVIKLLL